MEKKIKTVVELDEWIQSHRELVAHRNPSEIADILTAAGVADYMVVRAWLQKQTTNVFKSY